MIKSWFMHLFVLSVSIFLVIPTYFLFLVQVSQFVNGPSFGHAERLYESRKHLNETLLGNSRYAVDDFIDSKRINQLSKFLKKHKHLFQRYGNNYKLPMADALFQGIFSGDIVPNCTWGVECTPLPDQALHILKTTPHKYIDDELLSEAENYIYIRDKLYEYASEVMNTTVALTQFGAFFYFFPKNVKSELFMNGTDYIFAPHSDLCGFRSYDQPLILDRSQPHNLYRKYTVVLYIDVPPPSAQAGGIFKFIDLPNRYKLPLKKSKRYFKDGFQHIDGGAFADTEATFQTVEPARGKILLFPAVSHLHAVTGYKGDTDRYALSMFLTDEQGNYEQLRNIMPQDEREDPNSFAHEALNQPYVPPKPTASDKTDELTDITDEPEITGNIVEIDHRDRLLTRVSSDRSNKVWYYNPGQVF